MVDLLDDRRSSGFDSKDGGSLDDLTMPERKTNSTRSAAFSSRFNQEERKETANVVCSRLGPDNSLHPHDVLQPVALDEEDVLGLIVRVLRDERSIDGVDSLHRIQAEPDVSSADDSNEREGDWSRYEP
jgi:hypothetical protein